MSDPVFEITQAATFDAAHFLPAGPPDSSYRRVHGHSFRVEATVRGKAEPPIGWVADLGLLEDALKALAVRLDHGTLNDVPGLDSPTLERLCVWFAEGLKGDFPGLSKIVVSRPSVGESCAFTL